MESKFDDKFKELSSSIADGFKDQDSKQNTKFAELKKFLGEELTKTANRPTPTPSRVSVANSKANSAVSVATGKANSAVRAGSATPKGLPKP